MTISAIRHERDARGEEQMGGPDLQYTEPDDDRIDRLAAHAAAHAAFALAVALNPAGFVLVQLEVDDAGHGRAGRVALALVEFDDERRVLRRPLEGRLEAREHRQMVGSGGGRKQGDWMAGSRSSVSRADEVAMLMVGDEPRHGRG